MRFLRPPTFPLILSFDIFKRRSFVFHRYLLVFKFRVGEFDFLHTAAAQHTYMETNLLTFVLIVMHDI